MTGEASEADALQSGIFFRRGERPPGEWRGVVLNVVPAAERASVRQALAQLWTMWGELAEGRVRDLAPLQPGDPEVALDGAGLTPLLAYGRRLFGDEAHMPRLLPEEARPPELARLFSGAAQPFKKLVWAEDATPLAAQGDIFVQFFAHSDLAVNRAIVETHKLILDQKLPLELVTFYRGAHRPDGRSWLDFHDGLNNLPTAQRRLAMEVTNDSQTWFRGGTYLCFLRIAVDLAAWRALSRAQQELVVGRNKLTGCPLVAATSDGQGQVTLEFQTGCPVADPAQRPPVEFIDPPPAAGLARTSHIHRANLNRGSPAAAGNNRIYRQGYEFLEPAGPGKLSAGLNFISFQRSMDAVRGILGTAGWMGDVNFGGSLDEPRAAPPLPLMSLISGGLYAVPPRGGAFPGEALFA